MGYPTATTIWPSPNCPPEVRQLIDRFFLLADTKEDDVGARIAKDLFTPDGTLITPGGIFQGAEISESRANAWTSVRSRRHVVLKVYRNNANHEDLFIAGVLTLESLDGTKSDREFVARMEIERIRPEPKIKQYHVVRPAPPNPHPLFEV